MDPGQIEREQIERDEEWCRWCACVPCQCICATCGETLNPRTFDCDACRDHEIESQIARYGRNEP